MLVDSARSSDLFIPEPTPIAEGTQRNWASREQPYAQTICPASEDNVIEVSHSIQHAPTPVQVLSLSRNQDTILQQARIDEPFAKPKRGLSAYNLFFQKERKNLVRLQEQQGSNKSCGIGFADMARIIAKKWKALDRKQKAQYQHVADKDSARYEREISKWKQRETQRELALWKRSQRAQGMTTKTPTSVNDLQSMRMRGMTAPVPNQSKTTETAPTNSWNEEGHNPMEEFSPLPLQAGEPSMHEVESMIRTRLPPVERLQGPFPAIPRSADRMPNDHTASALREVSSMPEPPREETFTQNTPSSTDPREPLMMRSQHEEETLLRNAWETLNMSMTMGSSSRS